MGRGTRKPPNTPSAPDAPKAKGTVRSNKAAKTAANKAKDLETRLNAIQVSQQIPGSPVEEMLTEAISKHGAEAVQNGLDQRKLGHLMPQDQPSDIPTDVPEDVPETVVASPAMATTAAEQMQDLMDAGYTRDDLLKMSLAERMTRLKQVLAEKIAAIEGNNAVEAARPQAVADQQSDAMARQMQEEAAARLAAREAAAQAAPAPEDAAPPTVEVSPDDVALLRDEYGFTDDQIAGMDPEEIALTADDIREKMGMERKDVTNWLVKTGELTPVDGTAAPAADESPATPFEYPPAPAQQGPMDLGRAFMLLTNAGYTVDDIAGMDPDVLRRAVRYAEMGNMKPGSKFNSPLAALLGDEFAPPPRQPLTPEEPPAAPEVTPEAPPPVNPLAGLTGTAMVSNQFPVRESATAGLVDMRLAPLPAASAPGTPAMKDLLPTSFKNLADITSDPRSLQVNIGAVTQPDLSQPNVHYAGTVPPASVRSVNASGPNPPQTTAGPEVPPPTPLTTMQKVKRYGGMAAGLIGAGATAWSLMPDDDQTDSVDQLTRQILMDGTDLRKGLGNWETVPAGR